MMSSDETAPAARTFQVDKQKALDTVQDYMYPVQTSDDLLPNDTEDQIGKRISNELEISGAGMREIEAEWEWENRVKQEWGKKVDLEEHVANQFHRIATLWLRNGRVSLTRNRVRDSLADASNDPEGDLRLLLHKGLLMQLQNNFFKPSPYGLGLLRRA